VKLRAAHLGPEAMEAVRFPTASWQRLISKAEYPRKPSDLLRASKRGEVILAVCTHGLTSGPQSKFYLT
jgi:hypothetical protein